MSGVSPELSPLWLSLRSASLAVLLVAPLGFACARRLRQLRGWQRGLAELAVLSPLVLPPTVVGFILLQLLGRYGPIGSLLNRFGFEIVFSWQATVLSSVVAAFPLMVRSALASLEQIDESLPQVARSLGASEGRILRQIILPLAMPGLVAGVSLSFARALGEFGTTLMLAGNIPGRTQTLPLAIFAAVDAGDTGKAWFWTALVLSLNAISLVLMQLLEGRSWQRRRRRSARLPKPFLRREVDAAAELDPIAFCIPGHNGRHREIPFRLVLAVRRRLVDFDLDLQIASSCRRLGILGASGAGKSQLLRALAGLERPDSGHIELNGRVLFDRRLGIDLPLRQRRLGLVFQNYALFPHLSVAENVGFGLSQLPAAERRQRVAAQLKRVGLLAMADRYPAELSGGQQQRVALIRALAIEPDVLLLDEPFSAQDTYLRRQLQQQLADLLQDCHVPALLVTHDLEEAYRLSDDLLVIDQGRILAHGPKHEVFDHPEQLVVARLSGCKNFSRLRPLSPTRLWALDWHLELQLDQPAPADLTHVGVRANHLRLDPDPGTGAIGVDQWRVQLIKSSEGPFQVIAYVALADHPGRARALIQVEVRRQDWQRLCDHPQPWILTMANQRLLLLRHRGNDGDRTAGLQLLPLVCER
ncbi:molybdate ABC transporter permease subunit [Vulcanococcus limneticus Candia 3F8]|uniref:molybdate ABC transporter permease subunit n=1 Tax=Vulcanococcus limneticus TaxID=2170428 RepID=UPI000B9955E1|nr:molybdate ABC transporter permease subunit [Vulcanococcus limneticus]MCP9792940.1 molybdate ABC transporter permease subunit [Vulcanococcus limneticus MW73D5]MCP9894845.1 molybdate ABC transporter permease subunit [Vulcanococcus limneticus Candia 3F8]MCP9898688.1 molybdate ABC transporter permease subunit [Vulcanococcus limneticus Candia 3B3]